MICVRSLTKCALMCSIAAGVLFSFTPAVTAQSVRGHGEISNGPGISPSQISVNAWIDATGVAHGMMAWIGDIPNAPPYTPGTGGPADPFIMDVFDIVFNGDSALVTGVVVASPGGMSDGLVVQFLFTDNSAIGLPDEIDGIPIIAGNITVDD